jgi:hypothetical protein
MVELQLQIVRESSTQSLGINILAVESKNGKVVVVEKVAPNCIAELGGLKVCPRFFTMIVVFKC